MAARREYVLSTRELDAELCSALEQVCREYGSLESTESMPVLWRIGCHDAHAELSSDCGLILADILHRDADTLADRVGALLRQKFPMQCEIVRGYLNIRLPAEGVIVADDPGLSTIPEGESAIVVLNSSALVRCSDTRRGAEFLRARLLASSLLQFVSLSRSTDCQIVFVQDGRRIAEWRGGPRSALSYADVICESRWWDSILPACGSWDDAGSREFQSLEQWSSAKPGREAHFWCSPAELDILMSSECWNTFRRRAGQSANSGIRVRTIPPLCDKPHASDLPEQLVPPQMSGSAAATWGLHFASGIADPEIEAVPSSGVHLGELLYATELRLARMQLMSQERPEEKSGERPQALRLGGEDLAACSAELQAIFRKVVLALRYLPQQVFRDTCRGEIPGALAVVRQFLLSVRKLLNSRAFLASLEQNPGGNAALVLARAHGMVSDMVKHWLGENVLKKCDL